MHTPATSPIPFSWKLLDLFGRDERRGLLALLVLMLVATALETLGAGLVLPALALLTNADASHSSRAARVLTAWSGDASRAQVILWGMLSLVAIYLVKNLLLAALAWKQARFSHALHATLSQRLFKLYLTQPYTFHLERNTAHLISTISTEVLVFTGDGVAPALMVVTEALILLGLGVLLIALKPVESLAVATFVGMGGWLFYHFTKAQLDQWGSDRQFHEERSAQHVHEGLGAAKEVIVFGRSSEFLAHFGRHVVLRSAASARYDTLKLIPRLALETLAVLALGVLTVAMVMQGRPPAEVVPTLGLFAAVAFRVLPSANRILTGLQAMRFAVPATNILHRELSAVTEEQSPERGALRPFGDRIQFDGVTFTYASAAGPTLVDVTCSIPRGSAVGVVGASGAGKSTFIDVLLGLLMPGGGRILVDGHDIRHSLRDWQDQIGYVPQFIYLTDDTLRRNVAFGREDDDIDEAAVLRAVHAAQLDDYVASLPAGLDTVVGERGVRISGGERQRVGIARALYHDPAVLVLDEATSALDTDTEAGVVRTVRALKGEKTVVVVSHRLTAIEGCDRVLRLEHGRLEEVPSLAAAPRGTAAT